MAKITLEELVDLAFAAEEGDPIDWGVFQHGKAESLKMIGASILDQFNKDTWDDKDQIVALATITKLTVENFILHSRLLQLEKNK